ncbi:MAG: BRO family protein [Gudongella sp.]|jgi:prophage antirepressor-like protein|nr:BRO family protein [Gudongella sp.]
MEIVGKISFDGHILDVYDSLDTPYFRAAEVAKLIDYSTGKTSQMLDLIEQDEHLLTVLKVAGQRRQVRMVTELGLYNILSQSRKPIARKWRRIVHSNLILMRRNNKLDISGQFDEWDAMADNLYIDEETGELMEFNTLPGGDVEIKLYVEH